MSVHVGVVSLITTVSLVSEKETRYFTLQEFRKQLNSKHFERVLLRILKPVSEQKPVSGESIMRK